jgi:Flp pilus assembly secretin CpaC
MARTIVLKTVAAALMAGGLAAAAFAQGRPVEVAANHTTLVRLPADAAALVIGNETIADAALYDARTVFVTGKGLGRTNMMALDGEGRVLYAADLVVSSGSRGAVQVYRGNDGARFVCAPNCEIAAEDGAGTD